MSYEFIINEINKQIRIIDTGSQRLYNYVSLDYQNVRVEYADQTIIYSFMDMVSLLHALTAVANQQIALREKEQYNRR